jgi:hypothetical protein
MKTILGVATRVLLMLLAALVAVFIADSNLVAGAVWMTSCILLAMGPANNWRHADGLSLGALLGAAMAVGGALLALVFDWEAAVVGGIGVIALGLSLWCMRKVPECAPSRFLWVLRINRWLWKGAGVVLAVWLVTLIVVNRFDDDLLPEVQALLDRKVAQGAVEKNGYFIMLGFSAPAGKDAHDWGVRWHQEASVESSRYHDTLSPGGKLAISKEQAPTKLTGRTGVCEKRDDSDKSKTKIRELKDLDCFKAALADPAAAVALVADNAERLERLETLMRAAEYREVALAQATVGAPIPPFSGRQLAHQVATVHIAALAATGRHTEALEWMDRLAALYRRQLENSVTLIHAMLARANLSGTYRLLGAYQKQFPDQARQRADVVQSILATSPTTAHSLRGTLEYESEAMARFIQRAGALRINPLSDFGAEASWNHWLGSSIAHLGFRPDASINLYHQRVVAPWLAAEALRDDAYREALSLANEQIQAQKREVAEQGIWRYTGLHNPTGLALVDIGAANYGEYLRGRDDTLALRAAVAFQAELLRKNVTDSEAITAALGQAALRHPFSGKVASWDGTRRKLNLDPGRDGRPLTLPL